LEEGKNMAGLLFLTALAVLFFWIRYDSRKREFDKTVQQTNGVIEVLNPN